MKDNSKQAKFFCESCGAEVNASAKFCNNCGKFFSSVRCPNCGKTGSTKEFEEGCPDCGYAVGKSKKNSSYFGGTFTSNNGKGVFGGITSLFGNKNKESKRNASSDSLPFWVYFAVLAVLVVIIVCLYSCL